MKSHMVHSSEGRSVIVIVTDEGKTEQITADHPNYVRIATALLNDQDPTEFLTIAPAVSIVANLSARVSVVDGVLHFDGNPTYNGLASTIQRYHAEGRDAANLVRFMERLSANPSESSREQLFNWTESTDLTIDVDGFIVGYKGVTARTSDQDYLDADGQPLFPLADYPYQSCNSGHGIVDGHEINGHLPMGVDVTVEMPRGEVDENPRSACSTGLHVGNYDYAKGYSRSGALLEVAFNPADVVSVPSDSGFAKLRCCRYEGVAIHDLDLGDDLTAHEPDATWDDDQAWDEFATAVPPTFLNRLRDRLKRKGREV